jgi:hypothetical protein
MESKAKRQRLLVDPSMQLRLLVRMGGYLLLWTVVAFHVSFLFYIFAVFLQGRPHPTFVQLYGQFFSHEKPLLTTVVVIAPLVLYDALKFSHRIAGPLYRCRRVMRDMAAGKAVSEFKTRKNDLLADVFTDFNALIRTWNARLEAGGKAEAANAELMTADY